MVHNPGPPSSLGLARRDKLQAVLVYELSTQFQDDCNVCGVRCEMELVVIYLCAASPRSTPASCQRRPI